jgi:hypothetical protein
MENRAQYLVQLLRAYKGISHHWVCLLRENTSRMIAQVFNWTIGRMTGPFTSIANTRRKTSWEGMTFHVHHEQKRWLIFHCWELNAGPHKCEVSVQPPSCSGDINFDELSAITGWLWKHAWTPPEYLELRAEERRCLVLWFWALNLAEGMGVGELNVPLLPDKLTSIS